MMRNDKSATAIASFQPYSCSGNRRLITIYERDVNKIISLIEMTPLNVFIFSKDNPLLAFQATFPPCGGQEQHVAPQLPLHPFMGVNRVPAKRQEIEGKGG